MKRIAILNSIEFTNEQRDMFNDYISFINARFNTNYGGDSNCFYICDLDDGTHDTVAECNIGLLKNLYSIITVEEWKALNMNAFENQFKLYDGTIVTNINPSKIVSMHCGGLAFRDDCSYAELNEAYALTDDVCSNFHGNTFIIDTEDELDLVYSEYHEDWLQINHSRVHYGYVEGFDHKVYFYDRHHDAFMIDNYMFLDADAARHHNYEYHDRTDRWYHIDDLPLDNNSLYHNLRRVKRFHEPPKFSIGFEIEKEDWEAVGINYEDLYDLTDWIKESDGSLCDNTGYELVTPAFDLYDCKLDEEINNNNDLKTLINADTSSRCGGHINIASNLFNTETLFEHISGWLPLFYSMYENRIDKNYSQAKKKHQYKYSRDKYSAIYIKDNVLEFRIPSAVKNVTNLIWRRDLMRIMCSSIKEVKIKGFKSYWKGASEIEVLQMMMNPKSKLYKHLRLVYTQEQLIKKVELFIYYSQSYNDKQLPELIKSEIKTDNITNASNELGA